MCCFLRQRPYRFQGAGMDQYRTGHQNNKRYLSYSMSLFGALIAIFIGASLVYKEIDKKTLYTILAQPLHRYEFVLGKYLGLLGILGVSIIVMTAVSTVYLRLMGGAIELIWFEAVLLIYWKLMLITGFAILMSAMVALMALLLCFVFMCSAMPLKFSKICRLSLMAPSPSIYLKLCILWCPIWKHSIYRRRLPTAFL